MRQLRSQQERGYTSGMCTMYNSMYASHRHKGAICFPRTNLDLKTLYFTLQSFLAYSESESPLSIGYPSQCQNFLWIKQSLFYEECLSLGGMATRTNEG